MDRMKKSKPKNGDSAPSKKRDGIIDRASGRLISATQEETDATQPLLEVLIDECGWSANQIVSRPNQWRVPSSPSNKRTWPVDVALFSSDKNLRQEEHIKIICECKKPDEDSGVAQLKIYLDREPHARAGIWFNGTDHAIVYKTESGYEIAPRGIPLPGPNDPLHPGARPALLTYRYLRQAPSLVPLFRRIRDRLAAQDSNVNRDEEILPDLSALLLLKIIDEQANRLHPNKPLTFQVADSRDETCKRIKAFLADQVSKKRELFGSAAVQLSIDTNSTSYIIEELQNYRLLSNQDDAISTAFQVIRGKAYKGEEGQYFTPPSVVTIATAAADPTFDDRVIDPACGSGSFLAASLRHVIDKMAVSKHSQADIETTKKEWSNHNLFAVDKDSVSVRLSKAYLSLLGDGSTHVYKADALQKSAWSQRGDALAQSIPDGSFNVVLTNPPFGTKLKFPPEAGRREGFDTCRVWEWDEEAKKFVPGDEYESRDLGIVFLERSLNLLQDGGRLAIVLPDTYLFSPKHRWLVGWLLENYTVTHSINVPIEAFEPHCRTKTSILVLKKQRPRAGHKIIGMLTESYGETKHGRPLYRLDKDGKDTAVREDEMTEAIPLLTAKNPPETKLRFTFSQTDAEKSGVLVASYFWRKPYLKALDRFADENDCEQRSIGDLIDAKHLEIFGGHGSPKGHFKGKGVVPYIKVVDIKNWRVIENPKYFIPDGEAKRLRRNRPLQSFDLVTPTRASKNIGLLGVIMPWQTHAILTREIVTFRTLDPNVISQWLLLVMMSLKVVNEQFRYLVLMQMNREDLGSRIRELKIPIPRTTAGRDKWSADARDYFTSLVKARESYDSLLENIHVDRFADRP